MTTIRNNLRKAYVIRILLIILIIVVFSSKPIVLEIISFSIVGFFIYRLISESNDIMPIGLMALSISGFQWLIAPIIAYHADVVIYQMSVDEVTYLKYLLIAYIPFCIGVVSINNYNICLKLSKSECLAHAKNAKILIITGLIFQLIPLNGSSIAFVKILLGDLLYVGIIIYMFSRPKHAFITAVSAVCYLLLTSIRGGMFHDLVVWSFFLLICLFEIKKTKTSRRILVLITLSFCLTTIQAIKPIFRTYTWDNGYSGNKFELFVNLFSLALVGNLETNENDSSISSRFNQGWIISRIYSNIPENEDYQNGKTILEGVESALIPRFLVPDKKGSGEESIRDFETFTGYKLNSKTSMGLSIIGEAYGNFGLIGSAIFMFLWGFMISKLVKSLYHLTQRYGYWIYFAPLICFDLIKAEINFISVLNWTVKAFIFSFIVIYLLRKYFPCPANLNYSSVGNARG